MARLSTLIFLIAGALLSSASPFNDTQPNSLFNILLQSFDWPSLSNRVSHWTRISNEIPKIKAAGFTGVWIPPISQSVDAQGYLPQQWYLIQGDAQLRALVSSLNSNGILPIADVVLNHRTAPNKGSCSNDYTEFKNPDMGTWAVVANDVKCEGGVFCPGNCGCGAPDTGENICYAPDLDHTNTAVQKASKDFVAWLKNNVGFKGTRWDVAKGFSPKYFGDYIAHVSPAISIGEIYDGNAQTVINWIDGTGGRSSAFDFPARFVLRDAIRANSFGALNPLPGVLRFWTEKSVTFVDNHDTTHSGDTFGSAAQIVMGNVYILTHPGTPCVYWSDWLNHQATITSLISIRKEIGINANSKVSIAAAQGGLYAAYVDGRLAIKLGTNSWSPTTNFKLRNSGPNWAVWTA